MRTVVAFVVAVGVALGGIDVGVPTLGRAVAESKVQRERAELRKLKHKEKKIEREEKKLKHKHKKGHKTKKEIKKLEHEEKKLKHKEKKILRELRQGK